MKRSDVLLPITRPYMPEKERFMAYAEKIWENRWLTHGGPLVEQLQQALCERLRVPYAIGFANGHLALDCAIKALEICDGEAITTPFTYISTSNALMMNNLQPVYCDIKNSDCNLDEEKLEELITERTKVIVPVHVYGFPCNTKKIQEIADKHDLKVIYDAAHAFGVEVNGVGIGTFGDASMFSFHATKVFHTVEGGAVTFRDETLKSKLVAAKNFGLITEEDAEKVSLNGKMTELHAAMGLANLEILDEEIKKREQLVKRYLEGLADIEELELFRWDDLNVHYNYAYFPVLVRRGGKINRDELAERLLREYNIQVRKYFYPILSELTSYKEKFGLHEDTPNAREKSEQVVTLPLFVDLTMEQVDYICEAIKEIFL